MSKFVFPLDKVSAPDTELLELGFPLYCGPKNQFQHPNNIQHPSERGRTCRDGSYKYLCVCLWLKCWLRTFALTYSYTCISWSGSGHEITPPSHDTDAAALLQAAASLSPYRSLALQFKFQVFKLWAYKLTEKGKNCEYSKSETEWLNNMQVLIMIWACGWEGENATAASVQQIQSDQVCIGYTFPNGCKMQRWTLQNSFQLLRLFWDVFRDLSSMNIL